LQLVQHDMEHEVQRAGLQRMAATRVILALTEQSTAQRQPIELLFTRERARIDAVQRSQSPESSLLAALDEFEIGPAEFAFAILQADVRRRHRMVGQFRLEVAVEQSFKL